MVVSRLAVPLPRRTTWTVLAAGRVNAVPAEPALTSSAFLTVITSPPRYAIWVLMGRVALPITPEVRVAYVWVLPIAVRRPSVL